MLPMVLRDGFFDGLMRFPFWGMDEFKPQHGMMKSDLKETEEGYELSVDLPGFKKDEIQVDLSNGYLTISASKNESKEEKDKNGKIVHQERYTGSMRRSFAVGDAMDADSIKASFENGVLSIAFPKPEAPALPEKKTIQIADK